MVVVLEVSIVSYAEYWEVSQQRAGNHVTISNLNIFIYTNTLLIKITNYLSAFFRICLGVGRWLGLHIFDDAAGWCVGGLLLVGGLEAEIFLFRCIGCWKLSMSRELGGVFLLISRVFVLRDVVGRLKLGFCWGIRFSTFIEVLRFLVFVFVFRFSIGRLIHERKRGLSHLSL